MDGWMDDRRTLMKCIAELKLKELKYISCIFMIGIIGQTFRNNIAYLKQYGFWNCELIVNLFEI